MSTFYQIVEIFIKASYINNMNKIRKITTKEFLRRSSTIKSLNNPHPITLIPRVKIKSNFSDPLPNI